MKAGTLCVYPNAEKAVQITVVVNSNVDDDRDVAHNAATIDVWVNFEHKLSVRFDATGYNKFLKRVELV